ncbi:MAG: hypothetical protein WC495_01665 [Patescibacteria group bacterium]|jgi:hypothetical protein
MKKIIVFATFIIAGVFFITGCTNSEVPAGTYDAFAQCLTDSGAKMYGASWCAHCQDQKEAFGDSFSKVTYVECATPENPNIVTQVCKDAGIQGYPTWVFGDGSRVTGLQNFQTLADKSGCALPAGSAE